MSIMDQRTLAAYDRDAAAFAREWDAQPPPTVLQAAVQRFFMLDEQGISVSSGKMVRRVVARKPQTGA